MAGGGGVAHLGTYIPFDLSLSSSHPSSLLPLLLCPSRGPICRPGSAQWDARLVVTEWR
jgi:hypothetical protein